MKIACFIDTECLNSKLVQNNEITQENDSHLFAVICYLPVVDDGDSVVLPADHHGAHPAPGSLLRIELQDIVQGVVVSVFTATCIVLYYHTNCIGNNADHEQSPGRVSLFVPVITTLLSSVTPLRLDRGEGRAVE